MAPVASVSFCTLSWWSPRSTAITGAPSRIMTRLFSWRSAGAPPSKAASAAMVTTPGVGNRSGDGGGAPSSTAATVEVAFSMLAA